MTSYSKEWLKIIIKADPLLVEPVSDFLMGIIGAGVETGAIDESSYGTVNGYVENLNPDQEEIDNIINQVSLYLKELAGIFNLPEPILDWAMVADKDWGKNWKEHFKPFAIVPGLIISPTWEEYTKSPGQLLIEMDPGMAFGTGHHATTSLALEMLKDVLTTADSEMRVLDVGTGTGILGLAAVLFGASEVLAIDNDTDAVAAALENVRHNGLQSRMQVGITPLATLAGKYHLVVANIVHDVLVEMAAELAGRVLDGGLLILSGILAGQQVESIVACFTGLGLSLKKEQNQGEWTALMFVK